MFGIPGDEGKLALSTDQVGGSIYYTGVGSDLTTISFQIPGTRDQSVVTAAGKSLRPIIAELANQESINKTGLTGSPFTREKKTKLNQQKLFTPLYLLQ
ncbi:MAG: hypothetical protein CM1200mP3_03680 [Chloroflexota bacterium]|nr:MAG: hypothetical protein CM1200mP3_03680 [Chloroflexota bacterium]